MLLIDTHTHPYQVNKDLNGPVSFANAALERHLDGIAFTEHAPLWYDASPHFLTEDNLPQYLDDCRACQAMFAGRLDIRYGCEVDFHPAHLDHIQNLFETFHIPYATASIHMHLEYWQDELAGMDDDTRTEYGLDMTLKAVNSGLFQKLNHLDFFRLRQETFHPERFETLYRDIFKALVARDMELEWNANGYNRPFNEPYPCPIAWQWSLDYPLKRVYGSDAHRVTNVGFRIEEYRQLLQANQLA